MHQECRTLHWVLQQSWSYGLWGFAVDEEALLGNHSAQNPAERYVASPGYAMGHWKVHQMQPLQCAAGVVEPALALKQGWASGLWGLLFCHFLEFSVQEVLPSNHSAQSPTSVCVASPIHAIRH